MWGILSPKYRASFITSKVVLPSMGLSHAVATLAMGTSLKGSYSPIKGATVTVSSENHSGTVLAPATHVSACESSSVRLQSSVLGLWTRDRSITRCRQGTSQWTPVLNPLASPTLNSFVTADATSRIQSAFIPVAGPTGPG